MPATWQFEEREGYLAMVQHGEESGGPAIRAEFQSYIVAIVEQCVRTGLAAVLVDRRNLINPPSDPNAALAVHQIASQLDQTRITRYVQRCAFLVPPDRLPNTSFPEDVFQNRGLNLRYFDDEQQAIEWLTN